jgi:hypothetical protein
MAEITQTTTEDTTNLDNGKQRIGITEDSQAQADATYYSHSFQGNRQLLPTELAKTIESFEMSIGMPVWLLLQRDEDEIDEQVVELFWKMREELPSHSPVALLIHSVGG